MVYGEHRILDKIEKRFGKHSLPNLIGYLVGVMAILYVFDNFSVGNDRITLYRIFMFDRTAIFSGQIWRVVSFIFLPPFESIIFVVFALYLYWLIGSSLERKWGSFRFNLFYALGIVGSIAAGFITGYGTNTYLNMSLFLAFAAIFPDFQIYLFFIIPVKAKWLALADFAYLIYAFIKNGWPSKLAILMSFVNIIIFFGSDYLRYAKYRLHHYKYKYKAKNRGNRI